jgi:Spy/CpxP family protein refolding chaperone
MTTRFKISLAAGLVALTLAAAAPMMVMAASAQAPAPGQEGPRRQGAGAMMGGPMRGPGGPGFGLPLRALDLTDDQQAQLKKIREAHEAEFKQAGEKMRAAREGMRALIEADTIDEGAIRAKSAEVATAEAEVAILNAKVRQESKQILTAEQQQKLKELQASRSGPMKRRGPRGQ